MGRFDITVYKVVCCLGHCFCSGTAGRSMHLKMRNYVLKIRLTLPPATLHYATAVA